MSEFDPTQIKITEQQKAALLFIQQEYMVSGHIPTAERISEVIHVAAGTAKNWLKSPEFKYLLGMVGIAEPEVEGVLSEKQLSIVNALLNLSDRRSEREKCEQIGITVQKLAAWRKDPTFNSYIQRRAQDLFDNSNDIAYVTIVKQMKAGDLNATKIYLEMTGQYTPAGSRSEVNIDAFLSQFIEILQRRVTDPALLETLANDFQLLREGKPINFDAIPAKSVEQVALPKGG